jgi:hypothetical protein
MSFTMPSWTVLGSIGKAGFNGAGLRDHRHGATSFKENSMKKSRFTESQIVSILLEFKCNSRSEIVTQALKQPYVIHHT